jgi:NitT/TauT family transport system substrate-binding protein
MLLLCAVLIALSQGSAAAGERISSLKVALLPIFDVLPFYVAESKGYFLEEKLSVRPVQANSAVERDQLMQSGSVDGMLTDLIANACFNRNGTNIRIVRNAMRAYPDFPMFRIVAPPGSRLKSVRDLAGVTVGMSRNTVIEYVTDRVLAGEGLPADHIVKESVPVIPERFQLLLQGKIGAATLPEPMGKSAVQDGAVAMADDSRYPSYGVSVLSFSVRALKDKPGSVRAFIRAWDKAASAINANPEAYRKMLLEKVRLPKNIEAGYVIPRFPGNEVPDRAQWADVMKWMIKKGLVAKPLPYEGSVTAEFLKPGR